MTSTATIIHATSKFQTPGPGAYMPPSSFGNESPRYSIANRYKDKKNTTDGSYQAIPSTIGTGPKWTLGVKHKEFGPMKTPGPLYAPPAFGSDSPKISFHQKRYEKKVESTPGPLTYEDPTLKTSPRYTMRQRVYPKNDGESCSPGPGKYHPDYEYVLPSARRTTIQNRTYDRKIEPTPGPYDVPNDYKPRGISFHQKGYEPKPDITPGPGKYVTEKQFGSDSRKCAIRPRIFQKEYHNDAPYQKIPETFGTGPKQSFRIRPKDRNYEITPGPLYAPPAFGSDMPKISMHMRPEEKNTQKTPGPYSYKLDDTSRKYTIQSRAFPPNEGKIDGPGPGKYSPDYDYVLPSPQKPSIHVKIPDKKPEYQGSGFIAAPPLPEGPKFTIGLRDPMGVIPGSG